MSATILIVDDEESILKSLGGILEDEGYKPLYAGDGIEALAVARRESPDLVLLDIWMPRMEGLEVLQRLKEIYPGLIVVMMSGHGTIETAVKSTKMGAYDFIEKPLSLEKVVLTVKNALGLNRLRQENASLRSLVLQDHELIGNSPSIRMLREQILLVAPTGATVLLSGENGTGKELAARSIHYNSLRRDKPFVEINCAAIPEELIEQELFGYEKGAFPGALALKKGKMDLAEGGTLFLDEIGDIPLQAQVRIVRFLQERKFGRIGGGKEIELDIRLIAATSRDLSVKIKEGGFSEELFYRLNVVPFQLPPLRERKEDVPELAAHFLDIFCRREGREPKTMTADAAELMKKYDWPGNVRELRNIVERLVIMTPERTVSDRHIPGYIAGDRVIEGGGQGGEAFLGINSLREAREEFEKEFIIQKLEENDWNISKTAESIELERSNLQRKIKNYGIDLEHARTQQASTDLTMSSDRKT
jgi:two-component system, NtrC family, nitrogen regulation response regulator NtrX